MLFAETTIVVINSRMDALSAPTVNIESYCSTRLQDIIWADGVVSDLVQRPENIAPQRKRHRIDLKENAKYVEPRHERRRTNSFRRFKIPRTFLMDSSRIEHIRSRKLPFDERCRKHRRRPNRLFEQRSCHIFKALEAQSISSKWLETHVWHAKRMKMGVHWGYSVAERHGGRGPAAALKALATQCVIHDMSYIRPIVLSGLRDIGDAYEVLQHISVI